MFAPFGRCAPLSRVNSDLQSSFSRFASPCLLFGRLVRQILQILLHQRAILLWVFLALGLLDGRPVALGQSGELAGSLGAAPGTIRATGTVPISLLAISIRAGGALPLSLTLSLPLTFALALSLSFSFAFSLAAARHRGIRTQARLRQRQRSLGLRQGLRGGCGARLGGRLLPG